MLSDYLAPNRKHLRNAFWCLSSLGFAFYSFQLRADEVNLSKLETPKASIGLETPSLSEAHLALLKSSEFYVYVDKEANLLSVRSLTNPSFEIKRYRAISGQNAGDKMSEGDHKTPEGIYFVDAHVPQSRIVRNLHGAAGVSLNYPNPVDRINTQTGSGIWIHGVESENRLDKRFDTRGCVAMGNKEIVELKEWLKPHVSAVVIVDQSSDMNPMGLMDSEGPLANRVQAWAEAWSSQNTDAYLAFYHSDFYSRSMSYKQWRDYKNSLNKRYKFIRVKLNNLKIYKHSKYWVSVFEQVYESDLFQARGKKRLYWVGTETDAKIIAEETVEMKQGPSGSFVLESVTQNR